MNRSAFLLALLLVVSAVRAQPGPARTRPAEASPARPPQAFRVAKALAAVALAEQAEALPLGEGGTVGELLSASPRALAALSDL